MGTKALLVALALALPFSVYAADNSWTNQARHVLKATPLSISGR